MWHWERSSSVQSSTYFVSFPGNDLQSCWTRNVATKIILSLKNQDSNWKDSCKSIAEAVVLSQYGFCWMHTMFFVAEKLVDLGLCMIE